MTRPFRHALEQVQAEWDACAANENAPEDARPDLSRLLAGVALLVGVLALIPLILSVFGA